VRKRDLCLVRHDRFCQGWTHLSAMGDANPWRRLFARIRTAQ
jgi:hypothetical protein